MRTKVVLLTNHHLKKTIDLGVLTEENVDFSVGALVDLHLGGPPSEKYMIAQIRWQFIVTGKNIEVIRIIDIVPEE